MSIPQLSVKSPSSEIIEALDEAGCVVVTGVTDANLRQSIRDELAPYMEKARVIEIEKEDSTQFYPGRTRRVAALVARSSLADDQLRLPLCTDCHLVFPGAAQNAPRTLALPAPSGHLVFLGGYLGELCRASHKC